MKKFIILALALAISGSVLGGLFATTGTTTINISVGGVADTGGEVLAWNSGTEEPFWYPIERAIGVIDETEGDDDGDGGGLASIWLPAAPDDVYRVTVYMTNAQELVDAYQSLLLHMKITATSSDGSNLEMDATDFLSDASVDTNQDGSIDAADIQILTPQKGSVSFYIANGDGTLVDADTASLTASNAAGTSTDVTDANVFTVGIESGTFTLSEGSSATNLDPDFVIEVEQQ